eukprot:gene18969-29215_t
MSGAPPDAPPTANSPGQGSRADCDGARRLSRAAAPAQVGGETAGAAGVSGPRSHPPWCETPGCGGPLHGTSNDPDRPAHGAARASFFFSQAGPGGAACRPPSSTSTSTSANTGTTHIPSCLQHSRDDCVVAPARTGGEKAGAQPKADQRAHPSKREDPRHPGGPYETKTSDGSGSKKTVQGAARGSSFSSQTRPGGADPQHPGGHHETKISDDPGSKRPVQGAARASSFFSQAKPGGSSGSKGPLHETSNNRGKPVQSTARASLFFSQAGPGGAASASSGTRTLETSCFERGQDDCDAGAPRVIAPAWTGGAAAEASGAARVPLKAGFPDPRAHPPWCGTPEGMGAALHGTSNDVDNPVQGSARASLFFSQTGPGGAACGLPPSTSASADTSTATLEASRVGGLVDTDDLPHSPLLRDLDTPFTPLTPKRRGAGTESARAAASRRGEPNSTAPGGGRGSCCEFGEAVTVCSMSCGREGPAAIPPPVPGRASGLRGVPPQDGHEIGISGPGSGHPPIPAPQDVSQGANHAPHYASSPFAAGGIAGVGKRRPAFRSLLSGVRGDAQPEPGDGSPRKRRRLCGDPAADLAVEGGLEEGGRGASSPEGVQSTNSRMASSSEGVPGITPCDTGHAQNANCPMVGTEREEGQPSGCATPPAPAAADSSPAPQRPAFRTPPFAFFDARASTIDSMVPFIRKRWYDLRSSVRAKRGQKVVPMSIARSDLQGFALIGQAHKQFLIGQAANGMICAIDQHAADERCKVEKLRAQLRDLVAGEPLKDAVAVPCTPSEARLVHGVADALRRWGWVVEPGPQVEEGAAAAAAITVVHTPVVSFPDWVAEPRKVVIEAESVVQAGAEIMAAGPAAVPSCFSRLLASKACRSAIMFNDPLSPEQCRALIEELAQTRDPFHCAHNRPSAAPLCEKPAPPQVLFARPSLHRLVPPPQFTPKPGFRNLLHTALCGRVPKSWPGPAAVPSCFSRLLASKACRSAIMFNDPLSPEQCRALIEELAQTRDPFHCAHNRPSAAPLCEKPAPPQVFFARPSLHRLVNLRQSQVSETSCTLVNEAECVVQAGAEIMAAVSSCFSRLLASKACRSAIMFNDPLSPEQCRALIEELAQTRDPFHCAHNRPSAAPLCEKPAPPQ